jgi:hypothetical protein
VLKVLVVEKSEAGRADFVDAICELPGVLACGAASGFIKARRFLSAERVDAVVVGALPEPELQQLTALAETVLGCELLVVGDADELVARIESLRVRRHLKANPAFGKRAAQAGALELVRAGGTALAHRLRLAQRDRSSPMQTLVLREWLPALCARFAGMMPAYVELVPVVAGDTPPVRCVPEVLEHEIFDIVLEAAAKLPWGGTIWLTAEPASNDTVRVNVLENGRGTGDEVTLRSAAPVSS